MYPRNDPEAEKGGKRRLCGFCSFENRSMAQAAKDALNGTDFLGQAIRIGSVWGRVFDSLKNTA